MPAMAASAVAGHCLMAGLSTLGSCTLAGAEALVGSRSAFNGRAIRCGEHCRGRVQCQALPGPGGGEAEFRDVRRSMREALLGLQAQDAGREGKAGVKDPLGGMLTAASVKLQQQLEEAMGRAQLAEEGKRKGVPRSWLEWLVLFEETDEREALLKAMQAQLKEAVSKEDYGEAGRVKGAMEALQSEDIVRKVMEGLRTAVAEERYDDASLYRDKGGAGLVGWWAGQSPDDAFGRILHIKPGHGRFVGTLYTAVQLAKNSPGTPVMELFLTEDAEGNIHQKAVYLERKAEPPPVVHVRNVSGSNSSILEVSDSLAAASEAVMSEELEREGDEDEEIVVEIITEEELEQMIADEDGDVELTLAELDEVSDSDSEDEGEELEEEKAGEAEASSSGQESPWGLDMKGRPQVDAPFAKMMDYIRDNLPGAKVFNVMNPSGPAPSIPGLINKLVNWQRQASGEGSSSSSEGVEDAQQAEARLERETADEASTAPNAQGEAGSSSSGKGEKTEEGQGGGRGAKSEGDGRLSFKLGLDLLDGPIPPRQPTPEAAPSRVQAKLQAGMDAFVFSYDQPPKSATALDQMIQAQEKEAAKAAQKANVRALVEAFEKSGKGALDPNTEEGAAALESLTAVLGAAMAGKRRAGLPPSTFFRRITLPNVPTDSLTGLFVGAFGPHGPEVVQLQRRFGRWEAQDEGAQAGVFGGDEDRASRESDSGYKEIRWADSKKEEAREAPYEYIEATKLTGDVNIPAGNVSFRAKVGPQHRLSTMEYLGTELGVIARYKGEGRFALPGFKNPRWVEGELLILDGRAGFLTSGAELGFIFNGPVGGKGGGKRFLVLFNRVKLPE